jgi:hypothetical protein
MKMFARVAATATAVVSISVLAMPLASAAEASHDRRGPSKGKITVCVVGDRGTQVRVGFRSDFVRGCETFRGLRSGETYRVRALEPRRCDIRGSETRFVRASRDGRTVVFRVDCDRNDRRDFDRGGDRDFNRGGGRGR